MSAINGRAMKAKGSAFEREVVAFLRRWHPHVERAYGAGRPDDRGDIDGLPGFVVEVKCHKTLDLAGWMDEAVREGGPYLSEIPHNDEDDGEALPECFPVVIAKRRGRGVERAYVVMELRSWAQLVKELSA